MKSSQNVPLSEKKKPRPVKKELGSRRSPQQPCQTPGPISALGPAPALALGPDYLAAQSQDLAQQWSAARSSKSRRARAMPPLLLRRLMSWRCGSPSQPAYYLWLRRPARGCGMRGTLWTPVLQLPMPTQEVLLSMTCKNHKYNFNPQQVLR